MKSFKKWYLPIISVSSLILLLIFFVIIFTLKPERASKSVQGPSGKILSESHEIPGKNGDPEKVKGEVSSFSTQMKLLNAPWGRDPFNLDILKKKSVETATAPGHGSRPAKGRLLDLDLTGIVFFDNQYMALINDAGVREGDTISGFEVLKIKRDYIVLLDSSGDYYTLGLK